MQVNPTMTSPALASPNNPPTQSPVSNIAVVARDMTYTPEKAFEIPTKADPQSVVQAQIEDTETLPDTQAEAAAAREAEQKAEAAARTKSIMGMLPADPSEVTKLMSALAAATSAEAIADIKLDAQPVD